VRKLACAFAAIQLTGAALLANDQIIHLGTVPILGYQRLFNFGYNKANFLKRFNALHRLST